MFKYLLFAAFLATAYAQTPIVQCNAESPLPTSVNLNGCTVEPCELIHGATATLDVTFTAPRELDLMVIDLLGEVLGVEFHIPIADNNVCNGLVDATCPVAEGTEVNFHLDIDIVDISFIDIPLTLTFTIMDGIGDTVNCFHTNAIIV